MCDRLAHFLGDFFSSLSRLIVEGFNYIIVIVRRQFRPFPSGTQDFSSIAGMGTYPVSLQSDYNVVVVGSPSVGRHALSKRFLELFANSSGETHWEDGGTMPYLCATGLLGKESVTLNFVIDQPTQKSLEKLKPRYLSSSAVERLGGFLMVFSVGSMISFVEVVEFIEELQKELCGMGCHVPILLIGNKCDLPTALRQVSADQGYEMAERLHVHYTETSTLTQTGMECAFLTLLTSLIRSNREKGLGDRARRRRLRPRGGLLRGGGGGSETSTEKRVSWQLQSDQQHRAL